MRVRELVLSGDLQAGDRISELSLVERLGVSRTPIRMALMRLSDEGLLDVIPSGGYAVREFSERDVREGIEVRGTLEGLAARLAAERGVSVSELIEIKHCLQSLDEFIAKANFEQFSEYAHLNARFHTLLVELADSPVLSRQMEYAISLPFAAPSAFAMAQARMPEAPVILTVAQDQHRCVVRAIEDRQGTRAQALMREHSRLGHRFFDLALRNQQLLGLVPGSVLIRRRQESRSMA
jgi:GntR family transcriptional regulator of vanillate catabolism